MRNLTKECLEKIISEFEDRYYTYRKDNPLLIGHFGVHEIRNYLDAVDLYFRYFRDSGYVNG